MRKPSNIYIHAGLFKVNFKSGDNLKIIITHHLGLLEISQIYFLIELMQLINKVSYETLKEFTNISKDLYL